MEEYNYNGKIIYMKNTLEKGEKELDLLETDKNKKNEDLEDTIDLSEQLNTEYKLEETRND